VPIFPVLTGSFFLGIVSIIPVILVVFDIPAARILTNGQNIPVVPIVRSEPSREIPREKPPDADTVNGDKLVVFTRALF